MKKIIFVILIILVPAILLSIEINEKNIYSYFKQEIESPQSFEILQNTYAKLSTGFKKKKFKLKFYTVKHLSNNIYKITLEFKRKHKLFKMKKTEIVYLWIGSNKIVFLTNKGKFSYPIEDRNAYKIVKVDNWFKIFKIKNDYEFKIYVNDGKIYLKLKL